MILHAQVVALVGLAAFFLDPRYTAIAAAYSIHPLHHRLSPRTTRLSASDGDYIDAIVEEKTAGLAASVLGDDDYREEVIPLVRELMTHKDASH